MVRWIGFCLSFLVFVPGIVAETEPSPFYLSRAMKSEFVHMNLDELERAWPAFQHRPFDKSGFNHLTLPFHYEDRTGRGHSNEALSFSFLLSNSLDWSPGCYCSRHAFFVFTRDRLRMKFLTKTYNRRLIIRLVKHWDATHAVGGKIIRGKDGYHGLLVVFDKHGLPVHHKEYDQPRPFFTLLGDMSCDTMAFLDVPPSKELYQYLCMKRCKDPTSLIRLGDAAFHCDRMKVYTDILDRDPDFADVRYWWALRKYWLDSNSAFHSFQQGRAMRSYLVAAVLETFRPKRCVHSEYRNAFPEHLSRMETLVGPCHPSFLRIRLRESIAAGKSDHVLNQRALKTAQQYPNSYYLLMNLYQAYGSPPMGYDADMLISVSLAMIRSNYMTGSSSQYIANIKPLCAALHTLGYSAVAGDVLLPLCEKDLRQKGLKKGETWPMEWLGNMYFETGQFNEAIRWYRVAFKRMKPSDLNRNQVLAQAAISAALAGRSEVIEQILRDRRKELDQIEMTPIIEAYRDVLAGKEVDVAAVAKLKYKSPNEWKNRQKTLFLVQMDLKNGTRKYRIQFIEYILYWPLSHQMWAIFDGYERQKPSEAGCGFYHALEWLYPDDPWVKRTVADYRKRTPKKKQKQFVPIEKLMAMLKPYPPQRYPRDTKKFFRFPSAFRYTYADYAHAVKRLIDKRDFARARELALRFNTMMSGFKMINLQYLANHLIHKVEEAEKKAQAEIFALR